MSVLSVRGGVPLIFNDSITTTGRMHRPKAQGVNYLQVQTATFPVKVYFHEADFTADANFVTVPVPALQDITMWEGPVELVDGKIWFRGLGGTAVVQALFYQRRG